MQTLYDNRSYRRSFDLAMKALELTKDDQERITLWCLVANSYLNLLDPPENEKLDETYANIFKTAFSAALCVEDVWEIRDSLWTAFNIWEADGYKKTLDFVCDNPVPDNLDLYTELPVNYAGQKVGLVLGYDKTHPFEKAFMAANNLSQDEYDERYERRNSQKMTKETRVLMEIDAAAKIFSKTKERVIKESRGDLDHVIDLVNYAVKALVTASNLSTLYIDDCSKETQYKGHNLRVEINRYLLETLVYPNGQEMSLYQNNRQILLDWVQESYDTLTKLDPEFIPPELPSGDTIYYKPPTQEKALPKIERKIDVENPEISEALLLLDGVKDEDLESFVDRSNNVLLLEAYLMAASDKDNVRTDDVRAYLMSEASSPKKTSVPTTQSSGGCYVATAVYGSYDCPQVWTLRRFRDYTLAETWCGRAFIRTYYAISPTLVKWFGHTEWFKGMWRGTLDRMVANLNAGGVENTPYEDRHW